MSDEQEIRERIEKRRLELNAIPWWRPLKRQEAARRYKAALFIGAMWEMTEGRR